MKGGFGFARPGSPRQTAWLLVFLLGWLLAPHTARAACNFVQGQSSVVHYDISAPIMIPNGAMPGDVLWQSSPQAASPTPKVKCDGTTIGKVTNVIGAAVSADQTTFPTGVANIGYRLVASDGSYLTPSTAGSLPNNATDFTKAVALQLVLTGDVSRSAASRDVAPLAGDLAQWNFGGLLVETFSLDGPVDFVRPTCLVTIDPTVVTMQAITLNDLPGPGKATAGDTPFAIQLDCSAGKRVSISIHANSADLSSPDVIDGQTGNGQAAYVGIQISRPDGSKVPFDTPIDVGLTSGGAFSIPFVASYYCTACTLARNASPGKVTATATYTLTYQ